MGDKAKGAAAGGAYKTYLPFLANDYGPTPPPVGGQHEGHEGLTFHKRISEGFAAKMRADPRQGRPFITWNEKLAAAACRRVVSMAVDGWKGHVNPQGKGPDWYVRQEGFVLPSWYWDDRKSDEVNNAANHVESLAYGGSYGSTEQEILDYAWNTMSDPADAGHYVHIMGEQTFATQTQVGICAIKDEESGQKWYLSILTAPPER